MKLAPAASTTCPRCGAALYQRRPASVQRTLALLVTATILYFPANMLPVMYTDSLGNTTASTIIGSVVLLMDMGSWAVAGVIFIASITVPIGKLIMMYYLCWFASRAETHSPQQRTSMYRITEIIGRWSMIDVFVVSILVGLVHLSGVMVFRPGPGAIAFGGVVIITMIAAEGFDPRIIWDKSGPEHA